MNLNPKANFGEFGDDFENVIPQIVVCDWLARSVAPTEYVTTIVTRDRRTGEVKTETFYGKNPLVSR
jgi:hypothetical protein